MKSYTVTPRVKLYVRSIVVLFVNLYLITGARLTKPLQQRIANTKNNLILVALSSTVCRVGVLRISRASETYRAVTTNCCSLLHGHFDSGILIRQLNI